MSDYGNKLVLALKYSRQLEEKNNQLKAQLEDQRSDLTEAISKKAEECNRLKAQVERLIASLEKHAGWDDRHDGMLTRMYPHEVADLLEETDAQSLLLHDAEVLESAGRDYKDHRCGNPKASCVAFNIRRANKLREQAEENKQ